MFSIRSIRQILVLTSLEWLPVELVMTRILQKSFLLGFETGAALILLFFLFSSTVASAGSYTIAYGFDDPDNSEAGKLDCKYEQDCILKLKNGNIMLSLDFSDPKHKVVNATILRTNWGPGCCYFDGGISQMRLAPGSRIALGVSFGRARRGLEYVESNIRFGMLYLLFSDRN